MKKTKTQPQTQPQGRIIRITCTGAATMPVSDIVGLQGNLKELSVDNYDKLAGIVLNDGFAFPLAVARIKGKPYGVLDGHQRHKVVQTLIEGGAVLQDAAGNPTDALPIVWVDCRDRKHAARLILAAVSQFGKVTDDGLSEFAHSFDLEIPSMRDFDIPNFDTGTFIDAYSPEQTDADGRPVQTKDGQPTMQDISEDNPVFAAVKAAKQKMKERGQDKEDQGFYVCVVFQSREQKNAFLATVKDVPQQYGLYMCGATLARRFGIALPPCNQEPRTVRINRSLASLTGIPQ